MTRARSERLGSAPATDGLVALNFTVPTAAIIGVPIYSQAFVGAPDLVPTNLEILVLE